MGAEAIGSLDPLRFGNIRTNQTKWIYDNVVSGISGYGNPLGVCNIGGDLAFDESFQDNCLVNVVGLGFLREDEIIHSYAPKEAAEVGYDFVLIGKPTDNSGMGGAAFASVELVEEDKEANKGAVQEPNPFLEQHILTASYDLFKILKEKNLLDKVGFKDHGAGGVMCATVELADSIGFGAEIDLEKVHIAMDDLHPSVIACAETQERFCWVCHPDLTEMIVDHYNNKWALPEASKGARASVIGKVTKEPRYIAKYKGETFCDVLASDLTSGLKYDRKYSKPEREFEKVNVQEPSKTRLEEQILEVLASENVASRKDLYENYDKHVQGLTVLESGEADAGVMAPLWGRNDEDIEKIKDTGFAITVDSNPKQSKLDPYLGAVNAVCESVRNVAAVGAYPLALTDCLNYGSPEREEQMWEFVEGIKGLKDSAEGVTMIYSDKPIPYISGNVSFYNQTQERSVAPSAVIACIGKVDDVKKATNIELKKEGNKLYLLGERKDELGGSAYYGLMGQLGLPTEVPKPDYKELQGQVKTLVKAVNDELICSAHDISDGGLIAAIAEMVLGGNALGKMNAKLNLNGLDSKMELWKILFSETGGFVVEVEKGEEDKFIKLCLENKINFYDIGVVTNDAKFELEYKDQNIELDREEMKDKWINGLRTKLQE
jgi:phosphoribosylformylglycinamidine synthase